MMIFSYWAWFGTIYLIFLLVQDLMKQEVDDRFNWFMKGITFSMISHTQSLNIFFYLPFILIVMWGIEKYFKKTKFISDGDGSAISWIVTGIAIINPYYIIMFLVAAIATSLVWISTIRVFKMHQLKYTPFYPVITGSFFVTCIWYGLYI